MSIPSSVPDPVAAAPLAANLAAADSAAGPGAPGSSPTDSAASLSRGAFWRVFGSTFVTIFLAELGDKTQVTTLLMSAQSHAPGIVFLGAGSALVATSLIGVLLGQWLARRVPPATLDTAAGAMLLGITLWLLWDVAHLS